MLHFICLEKYFFKLSAIFKFQNIFKKQTKNMKKKKVVNFNFKLSFSYSPINFGECRYFIFLKIIILSELQFIFSAIKICLINLNL